MYIISLKKPDRPGSCGMNLLACLLSYLNIPGRVILRAGLMIGVDMCSAKVILLYALQYVRFMEECECIGEMDGWLP